jgi:hypothetical protein
MIDYFNLPNNDKNVQTFYTIGSGLWQTWQKPRGCKFMEVYMVGGGGGGGAGATGVANTNRSGGAGGGSSSISRAFISSSIIPDILYISVGVGGAGGSPTAGAGSVGGNGTISFISVLPNTTTTNIILASGSGNAGSSGGGGVVGSSNAIGGNAGAIFAQTNGLLSYNCLVSLVAGQAGAGGGNQNQSGTAITLTLPVSGGAGGAGVSNIGRGGASITGAGFVPTINGGNVTNTSSADSGFSSFNDKLINLPYSLFFTGGAGGYADNSNPGGNGGNGAYGSGGGGGGAGTTGGRGGKGGDGLVIITCW